MPDAVWHSVEPAGGLLDLATLHAATSSIILMNVVSLIESASFIACLSFSDRILVILLATSDEAPIYNTNLPLFFTTRLRA
jgi:hypothetical protein